LDLYISEDLGFHGCLTEQVVKFILFLLNWLDSKEFKGLSASLDLVFLRLQLSEVRLEVVDVPWVLLKEDWKVEIPWKNLACVPRWHFILNSNYTPIFDQENFGNLMGISEIDFKLNHRSNHGSIAIQPGPWQELVVLFEIYQIAIYKLLNREVIVWKLNVN